MGGRSVCLAVPVRVVSREGDWGTVGMAGGQLRVAFHFAPDAQAGDWVLVHSGVVIARLDEEEARESLALLEELSPLGS